MKIDIHSVPVDDELKPGARNAIQTCLQVRPEERITLIAGEECLEIVAALIGEIEDIGSSYRLFFLEDFGGRPCLKCPPEILSDLTRSQVSIYAAAPRPGELQTRMAVTAAVNRHRIRHGHMVSITREIMCQGMRADFREIDALSARVIGQVRQSTTIRATSAGGTDIEAHFSPELNWVKTSGIITDKKWGNLPGGEIFTSPQRIDGHFVVDGVVGDYLCSKYGDIKDTPLHIDIENSRIRKLSCENPHLLTEFSRYTQTDENSNRVGEFAVGTNLAVTDIIGNILQDEKIPGIHIAFGNPYNEHTGQTWRSGTHIDCVGRDFDIRLDHGPLMKAGTFVM